MPRHTTAKPLTDEQRKYAAKAVRLVNHFVQKNVPLGFDRADFRSEMLLAVVRGASHFDPAKGSFETYAHRFMERKYRNLRYAAYRRATFAWKGKRRPRTIHVLFIEPSQFDGMHCVKRDGRWVNFLRIHRRRKHYVPREH